MVLGDRVRFTRAGSSYVYKGIVVEVVPKGVVPKVWGGGEARGVESYVVLAGNVRHWPENMRYV
jgi:hypothetical protein